MSRVAQSTPPRRRFGRPRKTRVQALAVSIVAVGLAVGFALPGSPAEAATGSPSSALNLSPNPILQSSSQGYSIQEGGTGLQRVAVADHSSASWAARVVSSATTTRIREPRV